MPEHTYLHIAAGTCFVRAGCILEHKYLKVTDPLCSSRDSGVVVAGIITVDIVSITDLHIDLVVTSRVSYRDFLDHQLQNAQHFLIPT